MIVNCTLKFPFCPLFVFLDGMHFAGQKFNLKNIHSFAFPAFRGFSPACGVTATGCRQPCAATIGRRCISALTWKSILCSAPMRVFLLETSLQVPPPNLPSFPAPLRGHIAQRFAICLRTPIFNSCFFFRRICLGAE